MGDSQTEERLNHRSPPTGVKVLNPMSGFPTWGSSNRRRNSQRIRLCKLAGFDRRNSTGLGETETPLLEGTQSSVHIRTQGKEQWPHRRLNQTYLLVLEGLLQRQGVAVACCGDKDTGGRSSQKYSLAWALPESAISSTKDLGMLQRWVALDQTTNREGTKPHPSADKQIKETPTNATASSTYHQSLPSGSLHNPLR